MTFVSCSPTPAQRVLLAHIARGEVARVRHARAGWAIRLTTVRSRGAGGGLGRKVDSAVRGLAAAGWAYEGTHDHRTGHVWHLTEAGQAHLSETLRP